MLVASSKRMAVIFAEEISNYVTHVEALKEKDDNPYRNSPFRVYKEMSSKKKGKFFELLVEEYLKRQGHVVARADNSNYDRLVNGKIRLEIKGSMLWGDGTHFRWQQIRTNQEYDVVCFVAIYPDRIQFYGATKEQVCYNVEVQDEGGNWVFNQHGGKKVNSGTFVIDGFPEDFSWFSSLEDLICD